MNTYIEKQIGLTLVELLIPLTINIVILTGLLSLFSGNLASSNKRYNADVMNDQLQAVMTLMTTEIQRAGYWANAANDIGTGKNTNPFMAKGTDLTVNSANDCITFTYDHDKDGSLHSISSSADDERYGFRLMNQAIQARPAGATFSCTAGATSWSNLTDPNIFKITNLTFALTTQNSLNTTGNDSIQQKDAIILAKAKLDALKNYTALTTTTGQFSYDDIVSESDTPTVGNTTFTRIWTVTSNTSPKYKTVNLTVSWSDNTGKTESVNMSTMIAKLDPSKYKELF